MSWTPETRPPAATWTDPQAPVTTAQEATVSRAPLSVLASANFQPFTVNDIRDNPALGGDANWAVATASNVSPVLDVDFTVPPGPLVGTQQFRALLRKFNSNSGNPTYQISVRTKAGAAVAVQPSQSFTTPNPTAVMVSFDWEASLLGPGFDPLDLVMRVNIAFAAGSPTVRNTLDIGAVAWLARFTETVTTGPAASVWTPVVPPAGIWTPET